MLALISENYTLHLGGLIQGIDQISLFVVLILILLVGGWVAALISSGARQSNDRKNKFAGISERGPKDRPVLLRKNIKRVLVLPSFHGDEYGFVGEEVLALLRKNFGSSFISRFFGSKNMRAFTVLTGLKGGGRSGHLLPVMKDEKGSKRAGDAKKIRGESSAQIIEVTLEGDLEGRNLALRLFPQGPLHLSGFSGANCEDGFYDDLSLSSLAMKFSYECSDFPLLELKGMRAGFSGIQGLMLSATIAGLMSRGCGHLNQIVPAATLGKWGAELDEMLAGIKLTQEPLYAEMVVVCGWCYFISGLMTKSKVKLLRSLELYSLLDEETWRERELIEWAGIKANESYAALMIAQMEGEHSPYYQRVQLAALEGMRSFRRDNFPHSWGKLMCKLALAHGSMEVDDALPQDYKSIELGLDEAIEFWHKNGQVDAICEAYYAKGRLAQNTAKRHMGVQGWERAENGFLAALALGSEGENGGGYRRADIRYQLGKLYLDWGTSFGQAPLLEKAIHHFSALLEGDRAFEARIRDVEYALAQCYLNYGGITNLSKHHRSAISRFEDLLKSERDEWLREKSERAICVAKARLALNEREQGPVKSAIASICSVIGQKNRLWPTPDVLLRLRARLRELLFTLEGDDLALDRAIKDRRLLVELATEGLQDLRWAVEVGDLVGLLSQRQYKNDHQMQDFNEAHYLLEKAIAISEAGSGPDNLAEVRRFDIPHIKAGLYLKLAKLLASFARVQFDEQALRESIVAYDKYIELTPRTVNAIGRAQALNDVGQIIMDLSEHHGMHDGLHRAVLSFSEAHDIYLEAGIIDLSNRMRRFLENAEAAILAYQVPLEGWVEKKMDL